MVTLEQLEHEAETLGIRIDRRTLPHTIMGVYSKPHHMIIIDENLTHDQQRSTLAHELIHAKHGDDGCHQLKDKQETRTRRLTATALISREDYIKAETAYDGAPYPMAKALDVTVQVLQDYQATIRG